MKEQIKFRLWWGKANSTQPISFWRSGRIGKREKFRDNANVANIGGLVNNLEETDRRLILRAKHTGFWINVRGTTVNSTVI